MSENLYIGVTVVIVALMTWVTRGLPYLVFAKTRPPKIVTYIGTYLPGAIMIILVLYCLRNTQLTAYPYGAAEFISVLLVVAAQLWRKNILISIFAGTVCYMILIRTVFPV
jgi:branched-subunit amino acid transport protein AzlD